MKKEESEGEGWARPGAGDSCAPQVCHGRDEPPCARGELVWAHSADSLTLKLPISLFPLGPGLPRSQMETWASLLFSDIGSACPSPGMASCPPTCFHPHCPFGFCLGGPGKWALLPLPREVWEGISQRPEEPLPPRAMLCLPARCPA